MKCFRNVLLLLLVVAGSLAQDGFDLFDALDPDPVTPKPKEKPKVPDSPKNDGGLDLLDAFGDDLPTKKPSSGDDGGFGFDLGDALGPDLDPKPDKPAVNPPPSGGGGGGFDDSDLFDVSMGDHKPDGGRSGGRAVDPGHDQGGADQQKEPGQIAGIVSAIGMALLGAAGSYFAYQKKKLCFKLQGGTDPESGKTDQGTHSDPQVLSNLLRNS
ncbi:CD99 molecule [Cynoglossus semilaevis]|nr:CD99 antigen-like [Cynoglossus semilaevis]